MDKGFRLMAAPLQGLTEAHWRCMHFRMFGAVQGDVEYFTPFIRVEKGEARRRDLRDFTSDLNNGVNVTPQIIFRDAEEWRLLTDTLIEAGATRIDMNLGCPFPPQVKKGRGAGLLLRKDSLDAIACAMAEYASSVTFSVKMRLGVNDPAEALEVADIINGMPLRHVTVHPRTARQQYKGELLTDELAAFATRVRHPVIYNGEVATPAGIAALMSDFAGVMAGRGLLARPSLFAEFRSGREFTEAERNAAYLDLMREMAPLLEERLCGASQFRDKMKPYWEYAPETLDRRLVKLGRKFGMPD